MKRVAEADWDGLLEALGLEGAGRDEPVVGLAPASPLSAAQLDQVQREIAVWASGRGRIALVVPDATRPLPEGLVAACIRGIGAAGGAVTGVVGVGLHRAPSLEEWRVTPHLRELRAAAVAVVEDGGQREVRAVSGAPCPGAAYRREVVDADGCVVVGVVELHQYAGFSGGAKGLAVGCASPQTIGFVHRPALLRHPGVQVGRIVGNPFRDQLEALAACLPERFEVQAARCAEGWRLWSGPAPAPWRAAVAGVRPFVDVAPAESALVHVAGSKGKNLYQASRGVTQLALQERPPLRPGAPIVLVAEAPDGVGEGPGERAFELAARRGAEALRAELAGFDDEARCGGGVQRAYVLANALARHPVAILSPADASAFAALGCTLLASADEVREFLGTSEPLRWRFGDPMPRQAG